MTPDPLGAIGRLAFALIVVTGLLASQYLFGFYQNKPESLARIGRHWMAKWDFSPRDIGGFNWRRLVVVSILGLFLELLMIRWISSEIRIFAYFKNLVLIACFLGFGLGCYFARRAVNLLALLMPLAYLVILMKLPWSPLRHMISLLPSLLGAGSEVAIWGVPQVPHSFTTILGMVAALGVVVPVFAMVAFVFMPIGQLVGWYLENATSGITGYTVNVVASLAGILLYTLLCFAWQPPAVWLSLAALMLIALIWPLARARWTAVAVLALCVAFSVVVWPRHLKEYWSPYQKLGLSPVTDSNGEIISYELTTNDSWYQHIINLSDSFLRSHPNLAGPGPVEWNAYNVPYRFYSNPGSVLVLGSGTGNDVAAALRNSSGNVTAVEIDPLILKLGRDLHFERPYQSPRVKTVVDDARSYIQNSDDRFDLIVFSLLDSHTTSSHFTNIRIDNFVYTVEALKATKRLLSPNGVLIIKFQVDTPWIAGRLRKLMETTFGAPPVELQSGSERYTTPGRFFVGGSQTQIDAALASPDVHAYLQTHGKLQSEPASLTTDNWPYFYQHEPGLPLNVIAMCGVIVLVFFWFIRRTFGEGVSLQWHFFFLGAAFLLLEAQIISKMALLFGTTWVVNSIVIAALLSLIVGSNFLVERWPGVPIRIAYLGIFVSAAIAYAIPIERYFFRSVLLKAIVATLVLCLPVFFAGIVFIRSFAKAKFSAEALGSNLFGALVGGVLESLSFWTGLRSLLILAVLLYAFSALALRVKKPFAAKTAGTGA